MTRTQFLFGLAVIGIGGIFCSIIQRNNTIHSLFLLQEKQTLLQRLIRKKHTLLVKLARLSNPDRVALIAQESLGFIPLKIEYVHTYTKHVEPT